MKRKWKYTSKHKQADIIDLYCDMVTGLLMFCGTGGFILLLFYMIMEDYG
jgi:hypothetical protein